MIARLVETLIATSGLMLLVLALRHPVRQSFGARAAYALWLLPALRVVMPPLAAIFPGDAPLAEVARQSGALSQLIRERMIEIHGAGPAETGLLAAWPLVLAGLWLIGAIAFAAWQILSYRRFCRQVLAAARPRRSPARGIRLLASPRVNGPMAFGLTRRFIVFPQDALIRYDVEEHAMALAHELAHHRRGDIFANAFALGVLALHWFNPVAWIAHRAFRADQEMACDADVIGAIRESGLGHAYGRALVKCASGRNYSAVCHLNSVDRLKRRLSMLSRKSPGTARRLAGVALTGAVVLGGLALTASGEGMAAQVGAKVSEALPIPRKADLLPSFPTAPAAQVAAQEDERAARADRLALVAEEAARGEQRRDGAAAPAAPPVPPVPPIPPVRALATVPSVPPVPPVPGAAPLPPVPPVPPIPSRIAGRQHVMIVRDGTRADIPSKAEIDAMVPIIEVTQGKGCTAGKELVNTVEERVSVDGRNRQKISILICDKNYARQARAEALKGLREARNDIAGEDDLSESTRRRILADLDRQIARLNAGRD